MLFFDIAISLTLLLGLKKCHGVTVNSKISQKNQLVSISKSSDAGLSVVELVSKYGYPAEEYEVETEDGYYLTVHRIPHGKNSPKTQDRPVVFLQHGFLGSSSDWVVMGPSQGLPYILADRGFDVFMGNARGTTWSRKHNKYNPDKDKKQFWDFSWHEIGYYDIPAMIDFAIEKSGQKSINFIGHSQGTTSFFAFLTQRPEYNKKINLMAAFSPVVFMDNLPNKLMEFVAKFEALGSIICDVIELHEFCPRSDLIEEIGGAFCGDGASTQEICANILASFAGLNLNHFNKSMIPAILSNTPAGSSTKLLFHFGQVINSKKFRLFDYGFLGNWAKYGSITPPEYDLSKVTTKVALFFGDNDSYASEDDVKTLSETLSNVVAIKKLEGYHHGDYVWANNAPTVLYDDVIKLLDDHK